VRYYELPSATQCYPALPRIPAATHTNEHPQPGPRTCCRATGPPCP